MPFVSSTRERGLGSNCSEYRKTLTETRSSRKRDVLRWPATLQESRSTDVNRSSRRTRHVPKRLDTHPDCRTNVPGPAIGKTPIVRIASYPGTSADNVRNSVLSAVNHDMLRQTSRRRRKTEINDRFGNLARPSCRVLRIHFATSKPFDECGLKAT